MIPNATDTHLWFQHWQRKPQTLVRLFCFPYAGGGASIFHQWAENFPSEIEVCPVQLPGRENRLLEQPFTQFPPLVSCLAQVLRPYLDTPYAFFGHSMGALISFELARYLRREGQAGNLVHLFVSGHRAPQEPDQDPPTYHLPEPEFLEELRRLKGTPEEVLQNPELLHLLLPLLRADFSLCETYCYIYERPLSCPISAFGGLQDAEVPTATVPSWQKQTGGSFRLRFFAGDHFFLHREQAALIHAISLDLFKHLKETKANA